MRQKLHQQLPLAPPSFVRNDHRHADELEVISELLDGQPEMLDLVAADLDAGQNASDVGRRGMSAEQVLRCLVLKQMHGLSYDELAFHVRDSISFTRFSRIDPLRPPARSTLHANIKRIRPETLEAINGDLVTFARVEEIESAETVRVDCTVVESNIHEPSDEALLWDVARVLTRLMRKARKRFGIRSRSRLKTAKRKMLEVRHAKNDTVRKDGYRKLLAAVNDVMEDARRVRKELAAVNSEDAMTSVAQEGLQAQLERFLRHGARVEDQTHRRVLLGQKVEAADKLVSIFEDHTDVIVKDRRQTLYGHKVCVATGRSNLVLDLVLLHGNPADSTLPGAMIERQVSAHGVAPRQAAFDGGFASRRNLEEIKARGVEDVCFSKGRGIAITDMVSTTSTYRALRDFRAGVEGGISFLKRCFGLSRCTWRSLKSFHAYAWAGVVSANLLILARHLLADTS